VAADLGACAWAYHQQLQNSSGLAAAVVVLFSLVVGVLFVLPVGGADVPIVISLLNAFTGLAVAASGYVLSNTLLVVAGTLVGASGTILTRMMASAMGRSVVSILFGAFKGGSTAGSTAISDRPVRSASAEDVAILLAYARKVVIVPGYGLAVAQAQHTINELVQVLQARGVDAIYGIHPGRRPDARPYERAARRGQRALRAAEGDGRGQLRISLDRRRAGGRGQRRGQPGGADHTGQPDLRHADPHRRGGTGRGVLKRSMRPGFAGIENKLLYDTKTTMLFGDAKDSLTKVLQALKGL
jgi:NAD(P) transhydrogenase subunit beta